MASAPFAVPTTPVEGSPNKVKGLDGWPEDTRPRNIVYRITMLESALGLARRGAAVVYIPKFIAHLHNESVKEKFQLKETPLPRGFKSSPLSVYLIKRKSDAEGTAIKKVAAALRVVLRDSL